MLNDAQSKAHEVINLQGLHGAVGWVWDSARFTELDPVGESSQAGCQLVLSNLEDGSYAVEFWHTTLGRVIQAREVSVGGGSLVVEIPPFARDVAYKVKPL